MITQLHILIDRFTSKPLLRHYRVTPRRNPAAFRCEVLIGVIHNRDSIRAAHG